MAAKDCCCCIGQCNPANCKCHACVGHTIDITQLPEIVKSYMTSKTIIPLQTRSEDTQGHALRTVIKEFNVPHFVHGNISVNLCGSPSQYPCDGTLTPEGYLASDFYALPKLIDDANFANITGSKGVVFHVGTHANRHKVDVALKRMERSINVLLKETENVPLLIETPSGKGTELCSKIEDFAAFYCRFSDPRLKVCIDTCHVNSAGYDPLEYMKLWISSYGRDSVGLVHFNDSKYARNSKTDRHAYWLDGDGTMGKRNMSEIRHYCCSQGIPMVTE